MKERKKKRAVTFVDVMMLVAVIGLLILLLPSLSAARKQAQGMANTIDAALGEITLEANTDNVYRALPITATNIIEHGNDWYEFTLNGNRWMYHRYRDQESLVLIPKENMWNK